MILRAALVVLLFLRLIPVAHAEMAPDLVAAARAHFAPLLATEATRRGIPLALADAVTTVESAYNTGARGTSGEVGLMQVLPSTADMLGFHGTLAQLADPATNIRFGVKYLAGAWAATGGRLCATLMKYRAGYGENAMSLRSAVYCRRALDYLSSINSPLATGPGTEIPTISPGEMEAAARPHGRVAVYLTRTELIQMRHGRRTAEDSWRFWAQEEAHIRELQSRMESRHAARSATHPLRLSGR
jgi:hypothetical protein